MAFGVGIWVFMLVGIHAIIDFAVFLSWSDLLCFSIEHFFKKI